MTSLTEPLTPTQLALRIFTMTNFLFSFLVASALEIIMLRRVIDFSATSGQVYLDYPSLAYCSLDFTKKIRDGKLKETKEYVRLFVDNFLSMFVH